MINMFHGSPEKRKKAYNDIIKEETKKEKDSGLVEKFSQTKLK